MKNMKIIIAIVVVATLSGCGFVSKDNEAIGQVKVVLKATPLICPDYVSASVSLGVITKGTGSVSHEDIYVTLTDKEIISTFKEAASNGKLVKFTYDKKRFGGNFVVCTSPRFITSAKIVEE